MRFLCEFYFQSFKSSFFKYNVSINRYKENLLIVFIIKIVYLIEKRL